jgi:hypothetical protein
MPETKPPKPGEEPDDLNAPRLTPQGRDAPEGEDSTDPMGGMKQGQSDPAEGPRHKPDAGRPGEGEV